MAFAEIEVGPEELAERIAMIRDSWSPAEREARQRGWFTIDNEHALSIAISIRARQSCPVRHHLALRRR